MASHIEITETGPAIHDRLVRLYFDASQYVEIDIAGARSFLRSQAQNDPIQVAASASDWLQMLIDAGTVTNPTRVLLADLPLDDPDRQTDPAMPGLFHARVIDQLGSGPSAVDLYRPVALVGGAATHLISRAFLATIVATDDGYTLFQEYPTVLR